MFSLNVLAVYWEHTLRDTERLRSLKERKNVKAFISNTCRFKLEF